MKRVLVVGSGGREHAIAWKLAQDPDVSTILFAPGNDGILEEKRDGKEIRRLRFASFSSTSELHELVAAAKGEGIDLAVIGPDLPLALGLVDAFNDEGIDAFGPTASAARIEGSKAFAKDVMSKAGIPTAAYFVENGADAALARLRSLSWGPGRGWVVKTDGLAFGKGVQVARDLGTAERAVEELISYAPAFVIEEILPGREVSVLAFCDGKNASLFPAARDHKRIGDGDQGANTGGMGACSPVADFKDSVWEERLLREVFRPALKEMEARGAPFQGILYAGLMVDGEKYGVLEFNARFGDPEAQVLLARMKGPLLPWLLASTRVAGLGNFPASVPVREDASVIVIAAAEGYPAAPKAGAPIEGANAVSLLESEPSFFYAGVTGNPGSLRVSGGRVLGAIARGSDPARAREAAYAKLKTVRFEGMQFRKDIAC